MMTLHFSKAFTFAKQPPPSPFFQLLKYSQVIKNAQLTEFQAFQQITLLKKNCLITLLAMYF